ncbi:hypothetical protein [Pelagibius sp.]|uniref:hypothetical protein n=1 Tax=Pelagibius sp. TaxID=1931238 RepID=UPI00260D5716|nr:hypothetical protein [Pelagibius sp.]
MSQERSLAPAVGVTATTLLLALGWTAPALAYIGPGAGLSLLGALWGVLVAVLAALLFLLFWPLRRLLRRRRQPMTTTQRRVPAARTEDPRLD